MKEIPAGLKEYLFAMYIGQKVAYNETEIYPELYEVSANLINNEDWFLQLRPLSAIADDESIEVAKIKNGIFSCAGITFKVIRTNTKKLDAIRIVALNENGAYITEELINDVQLRYHEYQYLQQQGFALSTYFKGTLYSVDDLVAMDIIKLIE